MSLRDGRSLGRAHIALDASVPISHKLYKGWAFSTNLIIGPPTLELLVKRQCSRLRPSSRSPLPLWPMPSRLVRSLLRRTPSSRSQPARLPVPARPPRNRLSSTLTGAGFTQLRARRTATLVSCHGFLSPRSIAESNFTGNTWDATLCPDDATCASNCALDGADYSGTYGITSSGNALTLQFKTGSNVGSRVYLMDSSDSKYQTFNLKNQEFTFTVRTFYLL